MQMSLQPGPIGGSLAVPPSKSMAHRLLLCAALGGGQVRGVRPSADIAATMGALEKLGAGFVSGKEEIQVAPLQPGAAATAPLDCGESGSTLRFLIPLCALGQTPITLVGAPRLFARPLDVYEEIFAGQGLAFQLSATGLTLQGPLRSGTFALRGDVSSQFISGLLFALPLLPKDSKLEIVPPFESCSYVELTRQAQALFGVRSTWQNDHTLHIPGGQRYTAAACTVEGDWSQGAVPAVVAALRGGIGITGLSAESAQGDKAILEILRRCGAGVEWQGETLRVTPPVNGLVSSGDIDLADCPDLGPILCALAAFCRGDTRLVNAGRLRIKESDRIASMQQELGKMGIPATSTEDTVTITGAASIQPNALTQSHNDHRVVMALCAVALGAGVALCIGEAQAINKSWPSFFEDFAQLGAQFQITDD